MAEMSANLGEWQESVAALVAAWTMDVPQETPTDEMLAALRTSPVLSILNESDPARIGTLSEVVAVCRELGKTDASLGWLVGVANSAWSMRANFTLPDTACTDMRENAMLAMVLGQPGTLRRAPTGTGWLLDGAWKYASGYPCSSYFFGLAATDEGEVRVVAVPARQLKVIDDWRSTGLIYTQSVTIRAESVAIPEAFSIAYAPVLGGLTQPPAGTRSYACFFTGVLMNCLPATLLGATENALAYVLAGFNHPIAGSTYRTMSDSGAARYEIGRLYGAFDLLLRAAEYNAAIVDNAVRQERVLTVDQRVAIRGRATQIMRGCVEVVQNLLWIYGSSALEKGCLLEKIWRDVNVGARHGGFAKLISEELMGITALKCDPVTLTRMF